jgi:hypothetical protein
MTSMLVRTTTTEDALVTRMADALSVSDGGFSVDPRTGRDVVGGYAVAAYPDREQQITGRVTPADVRSFVYRNADLLAQGRGVVGGWREPGTGIAYLDVSRVVATRAEAVSVARAHTQVAYWDFAAGKSVDV